MDKKLKEALYEVYRAPAPVGKAAFLKRHRRRELGRLELAAVQAGYVSWQIWAASMALFGLFFLIASQGEVFGVWCAAALTPFLALLTVTESGRSRLYRMDELERACRIPRQGVLMARMVVLGLFHFLLLAGLTPVMGKVRAGVYLLTPYLLTAAIGMELTRRIRGRECLLACGGAAVLVSALGLVLMNRCPQLYGQEGLRLWLAALGAATVGAAAEIKLNLDERSELQWN